jgi:uncharacterized membrane protein
VAGRRFSGRGLAFYGQMLAGGGIVVLYLAVFAALQFYGLIQPAVAFALMIAITVTATLMAHRESSQGLALLAVAGGFLTPFLVGGETEAPHVLFAYDAILVLGTLWIARRHAWPALHLVSFVLTSLTIVAWTDRHYTAARWLSTELWITLFAGLFFLIWRTLPTSTSLPTQIASAALGLAPLLYHGASLEILWRHTVGLLVYLIAATVVGVIVSGHARQPWLRLATWVLVALPALGWWAQRPARWDSAPFAALLGIYTLHLVAQLRESTARDEPPPAIEIALLHANGLWLWAGLAILVEKFALDRLSAVTLAVAVWYGVLAAATLARNRETALHHLALASAFVAAAVAIEYDGSAVTVAWAVEGAALVALGLTTRRLWVRLGGGGLLWAAVVRLVLDLVQRAPATTLPLVNVRSFAALLIIALLAWLAWRYRQAGELPAAENRRAVVACLVVVANVLVLLWATAEVDAAFARSAWSGQASAGAGAVTSASLAREVTRSTLWAGYALLLIAAGIRRDYAPLRILAIAVFALTVAKVFLVDLARLDRFYRILSTVGLGLLLLGASYLYQRASREADRTRAE